MVMICWSGNHFVIGGKVVGDHYIFDHLITLCYLIRVIASLILMDYTKCESTNTLEGVSVL